jgi:anti-sigma B factor antagonist
VTGPAAHDHPALVVSVQRPHPAVVVVRPAGALDLDTAPVLARHLDEQTAAPPDDLVVDLAAVRFLAAAGLTVLLRAHRRQRAAQRRMHVTGVAANPPVERVLALTGVGEQLDVADDLAALLDRLAPG